MGTAVSVPYSSFVEGGVTEGAVLYIDALPRSDYESFSINLCVMPNMEGGDVALHFNPRYTEKAIVRNYKVGGVWGQEERDGKYVPTKGRRIDIEIKAHQHGYKVTVGRTYSYDFTHRIPREYVQYVHIKGDVSIYMIRHTPGPKPNQPPAIPYQPTPQYQAGWAPGMYPPGAGAPGVPGYPPAQGYPSGAGVPGFPGYPPAQGYPPVPGYPQAPGYPGSPAQAGPIFQPPIPANIPIPGAFAPGRMIYVSGVPSVTASRFQINLACGSGEHSDLALHLDVRFKYGNDQNVVVRTSRQGGKYGKEEKQLKTFPFKKGELFEAVLLAEPSWFKVTVNNQHSIVYDHRLQPLDRVDHVQVQGDVAVSYIRFQ